MGKNYSSSKKVCVEDHVEETGIERNPAKTYVEDVCTLQESPLRILRAAESGNVRVFQRIVSGDPTLLSVCDSKSHTAAHKAVLNNHAVILNVIVEVNGNVEALDEDGNTPLHTAVDSEATDCIDFLLQIGANASVLNKQSQSPLHLGAQYGRANSLKAMAKRSYLLNVNQRGAHGRTPLHLACMHDQFEYVTILIEELHASPRCACSHSFLPVHEAAKHGSLKALEHLLQSGENCGCSVEEMMDFRDNEGNMALHFAVQSGDARTVRLCVERGAKISSSQKGLSTAVHLACAQGSLEMVKVMFALQPEEKDLSLKSCDLERMTPLHYAAMFDHANLVEFLVAQQAYVNALDKNTCTPLHLAASQNAWRTVKTLVMLGAEIRIQDIDKRTVLHTLVNYTGDLDKIIDKDIAKNFVAIVDMEEVE